MQTVYIVQEKMKKIQIKPKITNALTSKKYREKRQKNNEMKQVTLYRKLIFVINY